MDILIALDEHSDVTQLIRYLLQRFAGLHLQVDAVAFLGDAGFARLEERPDGRQTFCEALRRECLAAIEAQPAAAGMLTRLNCHVRSGDPASSLLSLRAHFRSDIIVYWQNRQGLLQRLPGDSPGQTLISAAGCPVELVHSTTALSLDGLRILVPIPVQQLDEYPLLEELARLHWPAGTRLRLMAAIAELQDEQRLEIAGTAALRMLSETENTRRQASAALARHCRTLKNTLPGLAVDFDVRCGPAEEETCRAAREWPASLVVTSLEGGDSGWPRRRGGAMTSLAARLDCASLWLNGSDKPDQGSRIQARQARRPATASFLRALIAAPA